MTLLEDVVRTLPVRPKQETEESDPGYLLRVSARNGLPSATRLLSLCGVRAHGRARHCPVCMRAANPIWSKAWTGAGAWWCGDHGVWLVDGCSRCGRSLTWRGMHWNGCRCGAAFAKSAPEQVPPAVMQFTPSELSRGSLVRWLGALSCFGLGSKAFKRADNQGQATVRWILESGAALRLGWPSTFHEWLHENRAAPGDSPVLTVNSAWPGLVGHIRRLGSLGDRALVKEALTSFLNSAYLETTPLLGRNPSLPQASRSLTVTARGMGVSLKRLQAALPAALPGRAAVYTTKAGRTRGALHPDAVPDVANFMHDGICIKDAGRLLGLSRRRILALAEAGLLVKWGRYIGKASCLSLRGRMDAMLTTLHTPADAEPLVEVLRLCVPEHRTALAFKAMLSGDVPLYRASGKGAANAFMTRKADVCMALRAKSDEFPVSMTVDQAAKRLGVKQQVAYHLVREGLLASTHAKLGRRAGAVVSADAIDDFERRFAALVSLASAAGVGARRSVSWGIAQGLKFVSGPSLDGGRQYFVERPRNGDSIGECDSGDARERLHPESDRSGPSTTDKE